MQAELRTADQRAFSNVIPLAIWTLLWVGTVALANFGPALLWDGHPVLSWIAVGVNLAVGAGWIVIHARYLRGVDELQRKILLDALAVALGVGFVAGFAYASANTAGLISFPSDIAFITVLMGLVYIVGVAIGQVRYR
jgi:hypothetical protein